MSKSIYKTSDTRVVSIEYSDIGELQDNLYESDDGEFRIEIDDLKKLRGNIEDSTFEALEKILKKEGDFSFRIY